MFLSKQNKDLDHCAFCREFYLKSHCNFNQSTTIDFEMQTKGNSKCKCNPTSQNICNLHMQSYIKWFKFFFTFNFFKEYKNNSYAGLGVFNLDL